MKKFLLLSNYAPKPGYPYINNQCPVTHRVGAHQRIKGLERYWSEKIEWDVIEVEKYDHLGLQGVLQHKSWDAIWLSGSPFNICDEADQNWITSVKALTKELCAQTQIPVIGICFGLQLVNEVFGGTLSSRSEILNGEVPVVDENHKDLTKCFAAHQDFVGQLPVASEVIGYGPEAMPYILKFSNNVWGIQAHPELVLVNSADQAQADDFWSDFFKKVVS